MREMTITMTTKVSLRFASTTSRRGGRRATTVRAAGTVRRSEINLHPPRRGVARALRSSRRSLKRVRAHR